MSAKESVARGCTLAAAAASERFVRPFRRAARSPPAARAMARGGRRGRRRRGPPRRGHRAAVRRPWAGADAAAPPPPWAADAHAVDVFEEPDDAEAADASDDGAAPAWILGRRAAR